MLCGLCTITMALVVLSTCSPDELWGVSFWYLCCTCSICTLSMRGCVGSICDDVLALVVLST